MVPLLRHFAFLRHSWRSHLTIDVLFSGLIQLIQCSKDSSTCAKMRRKNSDVFLQNQWRIYDFQHEVRVGLYQLGNLVIWPFFFLKMFSQNTLPESVHIILVEIKNAALDNYIWMSCTLPVVMTWIVLWWLPPSLIILQ